MARVSDGDALTPLEAKARLRVAAERMSPTRFVQRKPGDAVLMGLVGGMLVSAAPRVGTRATRLAATLLGRYLAKEIRGGGPSGSERSA